MAQSGEHHNSNLRVAGMRPDMAVDFPHPVVFGGQCSSKAESVSMKEYENKFLS